MQFPQLFMLLLGGRPPGRHTEQHDILFAIGNSPKYLIEQINNFWPEAKGRLHVDAWRAINAVHGFEIKVVDRAGEDNIGTASNKLFFINLGGYKENEFDEQHYKLLSVNPDSASAIKEAKQSLFFKYNHIPGAPSHIDDKYAIDVDDLYEVEDILPTAQKEKYALQISEKANLPEDEVHLGYFKLSTLP